MTRLSYDIIATDGIVKAYGAMIPFPNAPLPRQYLAQVAARFYVERKPEACLIVTNNGKVWSYAVRPYHVLIPEGMSHAFPAAYISRDLHKRAGVVSRGRLEGGYREPVEWAVRDLARRAKLPADSPEALQLNVAYEREAESEAGRRLPGPCGPIRYTGFSATMGAYTLDQIHETVSRAVAAAVATWSWKTSPPTPWKPSNLEIMAHTGNQAMGLAFAPGTGRMENKRTISLNDRLFKEYTLESLWRVVVHELCHHYREEALPGNDVDAEMAERIRQAATAHFDAAAKEHGIQVAIRSRRQAEAALQTHDTVFIRELGRVDPRVAENAYSGLLFTEYADPSLVAQLREKRREKLRKISWRPDQGRIWIDRLKSGEGVAYWVPLEGSKVKIGPVNKSSMLTLVSNLGGASGLGGNEMAQAVFRTAMTYSDRWPEHLRMSTFESFITMLKTRFNITVFEG